MDEKKLGKKSATSNGGGEGVFTPSLPLPSTSTYIAELENGGAQIWLGIGKKWSLCSYMKVPRQPKERRTRLKQDGS